MYFKKGNFMLIFKDGHLGLEGSDQQEIVNFLTRLLGNGPSQMGMNMVMQGVGMDSLKSSNIKGDKCDFCEGKEKVGRLVQGKIVQKLLFQCSDCMKKEEGK